jgi:predicted nucleic acid-binding protein
MPFVIDASITMSLCFADESAPYSRGVLQSLLDTYAEVPALWLFEVANVLAVGERRQRITAALSDEFLKALSGLDIRVEQRTLPVTSKDLLLLVRRYGLTAYDAAYLELAKRKDLPLATLDKELIMAASQESVALVGQRA